MHYASSDMPDTSSDLQLEHVHKLLLIVAEQVEAALELSAPEQSATQEEIKLSALVVADYLRNISNALEAMVGKRPYPRRLARPKIVAKKVR